MTRVRLPLEGLSEGERELDRDASRYVGRVLRLDRGDGFVAFDPDARTEADAIVVGVGKAVRARLGPPRASTALAPFDVVLVQCVGKGTKLEDVVRDATEMGAAAILPATSERTVASRASPGALARWRRIAREAARQCGRGDVPRIEAPQPLLSVLAEVGGEVRVLLAPAAPTPIGAVIRPEAIRHVLVVGPEGGLSDAEIQAARGLGYVPARLGRFVLRTETAAAAALGALAAFAETSGRNRL